jgi:hypothetical protein
MGNMIRVSGEANFDPTLVKMQGLSRDYLAKYKDAASKSADHKWVADGLNKFRRDVSKPSSFAQLEKRMQEEGEERQRVADELMKQIVRGTWDGSISFQKAGVTTTLGYNYIDLRGPSYLLYPVNTPFRNSIARKGAVNAGTGTMAQWKYTRNVGSQYAGVTEGNRTPVSTPDENNAASSYKAIGVERAVTVEAEWGGEGFTGNLADEHLRGLQSLWLQEEGIILLGNDGTGAVGQNGFALGTAPAPVAALATTGGTLPNTTSYTGYVVLLTAMGNPQNAQYGYQAAPSVANGLVPSFTATSPGNGATLNYSGGMSAISAESNTVTTANTTSKVTFTVSGYPNGSFGFAWFVSKNGTPTTANAFLQAITQFPTFVLTTDAVTNTQAGNAAGLNTDNSAQSTDFTGLLTYAAKYGYWKDLKGATLTSVPGGQCAEVETVLETIFTSYQAGVETIWGSPDAIKSLSDTILANGGTAPGGVQFYYTRDQQNNVIGGIIVSGYQSRYAVASPTGANIIPLKMHPMIPAGTLYFDISTNPYPTSRIPATREIFLMRDYYGYEWPAIDRAWRFGTYSNQTLGHYAPWLTAVITGIGAN